MAVHTSYKSLLTERQFLKMVLANIINRFGDSLDLIAFQWIVYQITQSPVWIAIIGGINYIPTLFLQPFAGVLVERLNKRKVMILCDLGRGFVTLLVVVLLLTKQLNPWILLGITFTNSVFEAFRIPASVGIRPKIISKDKYTVGIGLDSSISRIVELVGFGLAGVIIAISPVIAIAIDCISFLLSAITISTIKYKEQLGEVSKSVSSFFSEFKEGLTYLNKKRVVLYLAIWGAGNNICSTAIVSFQTVYVADCLKLSVGFISLWSIVFTLGMSLGAFFAPTIQKKLAGRYIFTLAGIGSAAVYAALAIIPKTGWGELTIAIVVLLVMFFNGIIGGCVGVIFNSILLMNIDDGYVSRVAGVLGSMCASTIPLTSFLFAGLSSVFDLPALFLISAILCLPIYGCALFIKEFRSI